MFTAEYLSVKQNKEKSSPYDSSTQVPFFTFKNIFSFLFFIHIYRHFLKEFDLTSILISINVLHSQGIK